MFLQSALNLILAREPYLKIFELNWPTRYGDVFGVFET